MSEMLCVRDFLHFRFVSARILEHRFDLDVKVLKRNRFISVRGRSGWQGDRKLRIMSHICRRQSIYDRHNSHQLVFGVRVVLIRTTHIC